MTASIALAVETIGKSAEAFRRLRPAYRDLLDFYEKVFVAQEEARQFIHIEPISISAQVLSIKRKEGFPLVSPSEFRVDENVSKDLLKSLCRIALQSNDTLKDAAEKLLHALDAHKVDPALLMNAFMNETSDDVIQAAEMLDIAQQVLAFFLYHSIKPSLIVNTQHLSALLLDTGTQANGRCPICGHMPGIAMLEGQGERFVFCSFCWQKRRVQRLVCACCGSDAHPSLGYFYSEAEPEYRVDTCNQCRAYVKTIDARKLDRPLYPPLEQICTLHLDIKAEEMGFTNPAYRMYW